MLAATLKAELRTNTRTRMKTGRELIDDIQACEVPPGHCAWWWLGQHGFVVKLGTTICWLDAFLTPHPARQVPPLVAAEEVSGAVSCRGPMTTATTSTARPGRPWPKPRPPRGSSCPSCSARNNGEVGLPDQRVLGIDEGIVIQHDAVTVTAVAARNEFLDEDPATGLHPYLGYVIEGGGFRLYHAGDTCLYEGLHARLRRWPLDLAFLPINGRDAKRLAANYIGNMTYQEAADLAGTSGPD